MIARVLGYKARFCNASCRDGFKTDRQAGLNYGLHRINGITAMHREEWSLATCCCAYCGETVPGRVPQDLVEKFDICVCQCCNAPYDPKMGCDCNN